jgi:hypothetical protein
MNTKRGSFAPLEASNNDIPVLAKVKQQVNKVVERELAKQDF